MHNSEPELLNNAETNKTLIESDRLAALKDDYEQSIRHLTQAKPILGNIKKIADMSKKMASLSPSKIERKLNPLRSKFYSFLKSYSPGQAIPVPDKSNSKYREPIAKTSLPDPVSKLERKVLVTGGPPQNRHRSYKSEPYRCKIVSDTVDAATGRRRIELSPDLIFTHTDPDMRPYFKDKELIMCYGNLSKIDAYVYFTIDFQIASSHSQSNFGSLQQGSLLRLRLLNEDYVSLHNLKSDRGRIDSYSGNTVFTGQYALGKNEIKMLLFSELDQFRILWSTGYEDYDIYKVDFFKNQLECLMDR